MQRPERWFSAWATPSAATTGVGVHVVEALTALETGRNVTLRDGGTIGLALLSEIEESGALIAIDAAELGAEPGTVRVFSGADMDGQLRGKKQTAHEGCGISAPTIVADHLVEDASPSGAA